VSDVIDKIIFLIDEVIIKINLRLNIINLLGVIDKLLLFNWWNYKNINYFKIKIKIKN